MNAFSRTNTICFLLPCWCLGLLVILAQPLSAQSLPYHGKATSSNTLWWITQLGLGPAGEFEINNASNASPALLATTTGSGPALQATAGSGLAGNFGGKVKMTGFQLSASPASGYVLTSDASGNGTWKKPTAYKAGAGLALSGTTFSIDTSGASAGQALIYNGASVGWSNVGGGGLTLPYVGTVSSNNPAFSVTNSIGTGIVATGGTGLAAVGNTGIRVIGYETGVSVSVYGQGTSGISIDTDYGTAINASSSYSTGGNFGGATYGIYAAGDTGVYANGSGNGVKCEAAASGGNGIVAEADNGSNAFGVWGISTSGYAGWFTGNVYVGGTLSASNKQFKIDHPLDPAHKYLVHSCIESDQMANLYSGNVTTDATGEAIITLPDWFESLNTDFRYQLTCIGQFAQAIISHEIQNRQFAIKTDKPNVKVSWQVTGIRQDAYAKAHPLEVEQDKPQDKQGTYLNPVEHGMPESLGEDYQKRQQQINHQPPAQPASGRQRR